jgi:mono/diheme cytochrome c family protein
VIAFALWLLVAQLPTPAPGPRPPGPVPDARELFAKNKCSTCHGEDGRGDTDKGRKLKAPDFTEPKFQKETTDKEMTDAITNGVKNKAGKLLMPAFKAKLSPDDVRALVQLVRSFGGSAK